MLQLILGGATLPCVRENYISRDAVEQITALSAAKRRKNAAHGASRGKSGKPTSPEGRKSSSCAHSSARRHWPLAFPLGWGPLTALARSPSRSSKRSFTLSGQETACIHFSHHL